MIESANRGGRRGACACACVEPCEPRSLVKNLLAGLMVASFAVVGCSKATPPGGEGAFSNELKGAPTARVGVPDDGVKPKTLPIPPQQTARVGVPDDGVKPGPVAPILPSRAGVPDDSVKPKPGTVGPKPTAP